MPARANRALVAAVREALAARADPARAAQMRAYMKSALPFYGVPRPGQREAAGVVLAAHPLASFAEWRDTILALWREAAFREERYLALALARDRRYRGFRTSAALPLWEELIVEGAWWDLVDAVATSLVGESLLREHDAVAPGLLAWSRDASTWKRRAAIIAQVKAAERTDVELLYACIEPNRADNDFFIRKAIGWALRAYAWVDPDEVARYAEGHELSALSRREALKNIDRIRAERALH